MRRIGLAVLLALGLSAAGLAALLVPAHIQIAGVAPPLPDSRTLDEAIAVEDAPVRLRFVNTVAQALPEGQAMSHPAFVFEWADGRRFLVDAGMERETGVRFGEPLRLLLGADEARPQGSVGEQMGEGSDRVEGIAFTHLHHDHTDGIRSLCSRRDRGLPVFQTPLQAGKRNHTTDVGHDLIVEAGCARFERLGDAAVAPIPGFPGLVAVAAGGHTPGSTVYAARVDGQRWILSGDITNSRGELDTDTPKNPVYSLLIVPEASGRLAELRQWLRDLDTPTDSTVVVSHDLVALTRGGPPAWP